MKLSLYPEVCCDLCGEVVHNHIDCLCGKKYESTDAYHNIDEEYAFGKEVLITAECGKEYRLKSRKPVDERNEDDSDYDWEVIGV